MTISEIKPLLKYGDVKHIADICGYSPAHVDRIINQRGNIETDGGREIVKAATKLIKLRQNLKRAKRQVRSYNRKNLAS